MARFRKIEMRMHGDEKYRRLTPCPPCGQALWWHLIAGRQTGIIPGVCMIGESAFAEQLRWPLKGFREAFAEVFREGMAKADWDAQLVWIPNGIKYNQPASPNVVISWQTEWDELPECSLKVEIYQHLKAFIEGLGKGFQDAFRKACRNPSGKALANQEQEQEQEKEKEKTNTGTTASRSVFVPPTVAEVRAYVATRRKQIDPEQFVDFYTANGWVQGKRGKPVVDWKACVRTWERNHFRDAAPTPADDDRHAERLREAARQTLREHAERNGQ